MSLLGSDCTDTLSVALNDSIRSLHRLTGNAKEEGYELVVGAGATQLIVAALYGYYELHEQATGQRDVNVFTQKPFWPVFGQMASFNALTSRPITTPKETLRTLSRW